MTSTDLGYAARSQRTRDSLLDAAVEVLIANGYAGASTLKIQQRAGMSRGRLLHQYPNRDDLLVAAAQHLADVRVRSTTEPQERPSARDERCDWAVARMWDTYHEGYFWAATELWLAARYNKPLAKALSPGERAIGREVRAATDELFGPELTSVSVYADTRELLNTSMRGVALTYAFEPRDHHTDPHLKTWCTLARERLL